MRPLVVEGLRRPAVFQERAMMSGRDFIEALERRYLSDLDRILNRFNLVSFSTDPAAGSSKAARAISAYYDDQRLKGIADLREQAEAAAIGGAHELSESIRRMSAETFMRQMDWGYRSRRYSE